MKGLKLFFSVCMICCTSFLFASSGLEPRPDKGTGNIYEMVKEKLSTSILESIPMEDSKVFIKFFITDSEEIIVVETSTKNELLDRIIKNRLNYNKLNSSSLKAGSFYTIKVDFVKS